MAAVAVTTATGNWRSKTASELREIGDKSLILSPILVFEHELNEFTRIMTFTAQQMVCAFILGIMVGSFIVWMHYHIKQGKIDAVEHYKTKEWLKKPPATDFELVQRAIKVLQDHFATFHIVWHEIVWDFGIEQKEESDT